MTLPEELNNRSWYLVYSKPKREQYAQEHLQRQGYETYLPLIQNNAVQHKRRRRAKNGDRIEALFPRYLFIHLNQTTDNWSPIRSTLGVTKIVEFDYIPAQVPDPLVSTLMNNENEAGLQCLPESGYNPGDAIRIIAGPIKDYQGLFITETSKARVIILLDMLGKQSQLTIPANHIEPVNHPTRRGMGVKY